MQSIPCDAPCCLALQLWYIVPPSQHQQLISTLQQHMGLDLSTAAGLTAVKTLLPLLPPDTLKQLGVRRLVQKPGDMVLTCPVSDGWGIALGRSMGARLKVQFEYSMVRYGAVRYGAVRCGTAQHSTVQCSTVQAGWQGLDGSQTWQLAADLPWE
jgi:hypothetical protein